MKCDMNMKINMEKLLDDSQTNKPQKVKSSDIKKINIPLAILCCTTRETKSGSLRLYSGLGDDYRVDS